MGKYISNSDKTNNFVNSFYNLPWPTLKTRIVEICIQSKSLEYLFDQSILEHDVKSQY